MEHLRGKGTREEPFLPNVAEDSAAFLARVMIQGGGEKNTRPMFAKISKAGLPTLVSILLHTPEKFDSKLEFVSTDEALLQALQLPIGRSKELWYWNTLVTFHIVDLV